MAGAEATRRGLGREEVSVEVPSNGGRTLSCARVVAQREHNNEKVAPSQNSLTRVGSSISSF